MRILSTGTITTAVGAGLSATAKSLALPPDTMAVQANFVGGTGGTSVDAYLQTSFDGGTTWCDIAEFSFANTAGRKLFNLSRLTPITSIATPSDGTLTANTVISGLLGSHYRVKWVTVGTYSGGTSLTIDIAPNRRVA
jgi:hypothetical protein